MLAREGYLALSFDFRGFGQSAGPRDGSRGDVDVEGAFTYLLGQGASRVFLMGASIGGAAALKAAQRVEAAGVVALSSVVSYEGFDVGTVGQVTEPKLFLATLEDDGGYFAQFAQALYGQAPPPKEIEIYLGNAHGTDMLSDTLVPVIGPQVRERILRFLAQYRGEASSEAEEEASYLLTVNETQVASSQTSVSLPRGSVTLDQAPGETGVYPEGTTVILNAVASEGYRFIGWSGDCSGSAVACTVAMTANRSVSAVFATTEFALSVNGTPLISGQRAIAVRGGTVTVDPPPGLTGGYPAGTEVNLSVVPAVGNTFGGWGGDCSGAAASCAVTMTSDRGVNVTFTFAEYTLWINDRKVEESSSTRRVPGYEIVPVSGGDVLLSSLPGPSGKYPLGPVRLVASDLSANEGYTFSGWGGDCSGTGETCDIIMNSDKRVTVTFPVKEYTLRFDEFQVRGSDSTIFLGGGSVTVGPTPTSGAGKYRHGTVVTLTAKPKAPSTFNGWAGDCHGTEPCRLTMNSDKVVTGSFKVASTAPSRIFGYLTVGCKGIGRPPRRSPGDFPEFYRTERIELGGLTEDDFKRGVPLHRELGQASDACYVGATLDVSGIGTGELRVDLTTSMNNLRPPVGGDGWTGYISFEVQGLYVIPTYGNVSCELSVSGGVAYVYASWRFTPPYPECRAHPQWSPSQYISKNSSGAAHFYHFAVSGTSVASDQGGVTLGPGSFSIQQYISVVLRGTRPTFALGQKWPGGSQRDAIGPPLASRSGSLVRWQRTTSELLNRPRFSPGMPQRVFLNDGFGSSISVTAAMDRALRSLGELVAKEWPDVLVLIVPGPKDAKDQDHIAYTDGRVIHVTVNDADPAKLSRLAQLAVSAGFAYVWYENAGYLHVSVR